LSNLSVNATGPAGATVNYALPTATDLVDVTDRVTCTPAPGSTFAIATTTVTCKAVDQAGNTASKTFKVSVLGSSSQISALRTLVSNAPELNTSTSTKALKNMLLNDIGSASKPSCSGLAKFLTDVQTHTVPGGPITQIDALVWVANANQIRAVLSC
jgi:hypothetical protein